MIFRIIPFLYHLILPYCYCLFIFQVCDVMQGYKQQKEPISLFEHFFIVGLHSCSNLEAIEDTFAKRKTWEAEMEKSEIFDPRKLPYRGRPPLLEPQVCLVNKLDDNRFDFFYVYYFELSCPHQKF